MDIYWTSLPGRVGPMTVPKVAGGTRQREKGVNMKVDINSLRQEVRGIMDNDRDKVLFKTRPVLNQYLNLDLITYLITRKNRKGKKGALLNFFRTHPYIYRLLKKRKVKTDSIVFIDALFNISGETKMYDADAVILPCPFKEDFEEKLFQALEDIGSLDFLIIDDLAALQNYWADERIENFLKKLVNKVERMGGPPIVIVADMTKNERLLEMASSYCDIEVEVNGYKNKKKRKLRSNQ